MSEPILSPDDSTPNRPRGARKAWIRRDPPDDPIEAIFFLLDRIERVYSLHIMKDITRLYQAATVAQPGPQILRQIGKKIEESRSTADITRLILREHWTTVA